MAAPDPSDEPVPPLQRLLQAIIARTSARPI